MAVLVRSVGKAAEATLLVAALLGWLVAATDDDDDDDREDSETDVEAADKVAWTDDHIEDTTPPQIPNAAFVDSVGLTNKGVVSVGLVVVPGAGVVATLCW
jgi:hypothetical protein